MRMSNSRSVVKFGLVMKVMAAIHSLLIKNQYCTKRDLYYQEPEEYGNQRYLDQLIDTISSMLAVPRWQLHVVATSKGVISGDLTFLDADNKLVDCSNTTNGVLLPSLIHKIQLVRSDARFVLIVEKDATFQHLLEEKVFNELGPCIIITAKGYPDLITRQLLRMLKDKYAHLPFFALVDADPHGASIYLTYKFGSLTHAHDVQNLALPSLMWLGVLPSDVNELLLPDGVALKLSSSDRAQVQDIMNREYMAGLSSELKELQAMLETGKKIEIQCLDVFGRSYLTQVYLPRRLRKLGYLVQSNW
ncbi:meiotic recombination protein SPO11-like [Watersipora subatra]|uniref:meiotic recombination protein SPO11-like n=1 Tax=Watersipora subatra TaxID=2589382 RepID=UPI00355C4A3D